MPPASAIPTTGLVSLAPQRGSRSAASRLFFASGEDDWQVPRNHAPLGPNKGAFSPRNRPRPNRSLVLRASSMPPCRWLAVLRLQQRPRFSLRKNESPSKECGGRFRHRQTEKFNRRRPENRNRLCQRNLRQPIFAEVFRDSGRYLVTPFFGSRPARRRAGTDWLCRTSNHDSLAYSFRKPLNRIRCCSSSAKSLTQRSWVT